MARRAGILGIALAAAIAAAPPALARGGGGHAGHGPPAHTVKAPKAKAAKAKGKAKGKGTAASHRRTARGVVQSITAKAIVLTQLDGSTVTVPISRRSRVFVNGKHARLAAVKPGFVLVVKWKTGKPAKVLRFLRPT